MFLLLFESFSTILSPKELSYIPISENRCGNFSFILDSLSHVSSSIRELSTILSPKELYYVPISKNRCGNFSFISDSLSHVSSSIRELLHNTLTKGTLLFLNTFSSRSKILMGLVSKVRSHLIFIRTCGNTCEGSILAFHNNDTWNTLWILSKCAGNSNR
jgi:hypothetical protein